MRNILNLDSHLDNCGAEDAWLHGIKYLLRTLQQEKVWRQGPNQA
jgi:hypothetical protein